MVSTSGEIDSPCSSTSSPVFTIAVIDAGGTARRSPRRNRAAPTPPESTTVLIARSPGLLTGTGRAGGAVVQLDEPPGGGGPVEACRVAVARLDHGEAGPEAGEHRPHRGGQGV